MRRAARKDDNQKTIVDGLRAAGYSVSVLNDEALPDLLIGGTGRCPNCNHTQPTNWTLEVKRQPGPRGGLKGRTLTPEQLIWFRDWLGQANVARSLEEALEVLKQG